MVLKKFTPQRKTKTENKIDMQFIPIFSPTGGMRTTVPPVELENMFVSWLQNVFYYNNKIKQRFGLSKFGTTTPLAGDAILNITKYIGLDGSTYLVAFTIKNVYLYNATTNLWNIITEQTTISDCQDAWIASANVTSTADTTVYRVGTKSAKHVIADAFTTGLASYINFGAKDLTGYTHVYFYIRSTVALTAGQAQILLDDTNGCVTPLETLNVPAVPSIDTWYEFCIALAAPAGLGAILSVGLKMTADIGPVTIYLDQILAVNCFTGDSEDMIETEQIYDDTAGAMKYLMTNGVDVIKTWAGTGNFVSLAGSPNKTKHFVNFKHYLMLMNTTVSGTQAPQRLEWPQIGKPTVWTGEDSGNDSLAGTAGFLMGGVPFRSGLALIKDDSISHASFIGSLDPFEIEETRVPEKGCCAAGSIQVFGDKIIYLGWEDVFKYDGFDSHPVRNDITEEIFKRLNKEKIATVHSQKIEELNLYLLFVPLTGSSYPNACWVYNYVTEAWCFWKFAKNITSSGFGTTNASLTIGQMLGKIGTYSLKIGDRSILKDQEFCLFGSSDGYIYKFDSNSNNDDDEAIDAYINTKSYVPSGINVYNLFCQISLFGKGDDIAVSVSTNDGQKFTYIGDLLQRPSLDSVSFLRKIDKIADRILIKLQNDFLNEWFEITGWEIGYIERTRVVKPPKDDLVRITTDDIVRITTYEEDRTIAI